MNKDLKDKISKICGFDLSSEQAKQIEQAFLNARWVDHSKLIDEADMWDASADKDKALRARLAVVLAVRWTIPYMVEKVIETMRRYGWHPESEYATEKEQLIVRPSHFFISVDSIESILILSRKLLAAQIIQIENIMGFYERVAVPAVFQANFDLAERAWSSYQKRATKEALGQVAGYLEGIINHHSFRDSSLDFRLLVLTYGGIVRINHYAITNDPVDLVHALEWLQEAIKLSPRDSPYLLLRIELMSMGLAYRWALYNDPLDLDQAIAGHKQVVERTSPDSGDLYGYLYNLSQNLQHRYELKGNPEDLKTAIEAEEKALALMSSRPHDSIDVSRHHNNMGISLVYRYKCTASPHDLERAIQELGIAVNLARPSQEDRPDFLGNLAGALLERCISTGIVMDVDRAIHLWQEARMKTTVKSKKQLIITSNLGIAFRQRYLITGSINDLNEAIKIQEEALQQTPSDSPELPRRLNNFSNSLRDRFESQKKTTSDLDLAIQGWRHAVQLVATGSPQHTEYLNNLGDGLRERYKLNGEATDRDEAAQALQQAIEQLPMDSPYTPTFLFNLGDVFAQSYEKELRQTDLEHAIEIWEQAFSHLKTVFSWLPVAYKLGQQRRWPDIYSQLVSAYLKRATAIPSQKSLSYQKAMEVAEAAKSRILSEIVGRGDMSAPPTVPSNLINRERELLTLLVELDTSELTASDSGATLRQSEQLSRLEQRQTYLLELERLWADISQYGSEAKEYVSLRRGDSLNWSDITKLATDLGTTTAILSLFITHSNTVLFVVRSGQEKPNVIELRSNNNANTIWTTIMTTFYNEIHKWPTSVANLDDTWSELPCKILKAAAPFLNGVEHAVFVPYSYGHLLPWSVVIRRAGWQRPDGLPLPLAILPALVMLRNLRHREKVIPSDTALVVGNPNKDLDSAEEEAKNVAGILGVKPLIGSQADKASVLTNIPKAPIVHLATHAYFSPRSPLDSAMKLADSDITVRDIMNKHLSANLVVLSACETGMVQSLGGDEMAGLAQAFLQAGARSLLVSLWKIVDKSTAEFMVSFYAALQGGSDTALALSQAMSQIQSKGQWSHPYYWGAFVLIGDWQL